MHHFFSYAATFIKHNLQRFHLKINEVIRIHNCRTTFSHQFILRIFFVFFFFFFIVTFCGIHFANPCYGNFFFAGDFFVSPFLCVVCECVLFFFFTPYYFHLIHLHAESSVWVNVILRYCTSQSECIKAFCIFDFCCFGVVCSMALYAMQCKA